MRFLARPARLLLLVPLCLFLLGPDPAAAQQIEVRDIGLSARFQGDFGGSFKRGRALVAADFNLDGRIDFYVGNPGDESVVLLNVERAGRLQFLTQQVLVKDVLAWGAAASDYDNDGDYDLYISCGANEGECHDFLFKNMFEIGRAHV